MTRALRVPAVAVIALGVAIAACFPTKPDLQGPPPPTVEEMNSPTASEEATLTGTKPPDTGISVNGIEVVQVDPATTWSAGPIVLAVGTNNFTVRALDRFGNESAAVVASALRDPYAPGTVVGTGPLDGTATLEARPVLRWIPAIDPPLPGAPNGGGLVKYDVQISSTASFATQTASFSVSATDAGNPPAVAVPSDVPEGWNFWRVTTTDSAGNVGIPSPPRQFFRGVQGDFNGDGRPEIAAGAPYAGLPDRGRMRALAGGTALVALFDIAGSTDDGELGRAVRIIPDSNGDRLAEILVGAPFAGGGTVTMRFGGTPPSDSARRIDGTGQFGTVIAGGDLNRDGLAEIVVGAPGDDRVYLFLGRSWATNGTMAATTAELKLQGDPGTDFGRTVAIAGDTNGDGTFEIAVGAPNAFGGAGRVYLFEIPRVLPVENTLTLVSARELSQPDAARFGVTLDGGRDFDGDGFPDVVVGAPADATNAAGRAYVFYGAGSPASVFFPGGGAPGEGFGSGVALIGPFDGRSAPRSTIAVGSAGGDGSIAIYEIGPNRLPALVAEDFGEPGSDEGRGTTVAPAGDLDGDGNADLLVGAPRRDPTQNVTMSGAYGMVYVYYGTTNLSLAPAESFRLVDVGGSEEAALSTTRAPESGRAISGVAP